MKKLFIIQFFCFILSIFSISALAWDHSIELGYGYSHDPNHTRYNNSGVLLSGDLFPLRRTPWTFWSVTGSLGQWHSSAPVNKNVTTAAMSLALRFYPFDYGYLLASFGPAYLSKQRLGFNTQGSHASIQSNIGLGAEFRSFDANLRLVHYSNANLAKPNEGFNILYLLSLGYLF